MPAAVPVPWLFLAASLVGAWFTYNAFRPMQTAPRRAVVSFFAGWLTTELALHHIAWQLAMTAVFIWAGALAGWPGFMALAITLASWVGLARCYHGARVAEEVVERALQAALGPDYRDAILPEVREQFAPAVDWRQLLLPFPIRHPEVERVRNVIYARVGRTKLRLDVYRHRSRPARCPTLLQIHGGAWILGSKNEQGIPLMVHLAARGWVCISANYRLSPRATFPDHLIDLKRAVAWIRAHADEHGIDPEFVVVTGGSAGGHLASLVALTPNDPEYQPGFENADTRIDACVAFYGVYDFTDRHGVWKHRGLHRLLERRVMKVARDADPDAWEKASPLSRIGPDAPPFFVVHGTLDTLVPVEEARRFSTALAAVSPNPVVYAEIPGAQHAFEIFPSLRSTFVVHGVERFLAWVYSRHVAGGQETARLQRAGGQARHRDGRVPPQRAPRARACGGRRSGPPAAATARARPPDPDSGSGEKPRGAWAGGGRSSAQLAGTLSARCQLRGDVTASDGALASARRSAEGGPPPAPSPRG